MSLINSIQPIEEETTINKIMSLKQRPKPEIITSEALQKSIEIIAKYDYKFPSNDQLIILKELLVKLNLLKPNKILRTPKKKRIIQISMK